MTKPTIRFTTGGKAKLPLDDATVEGAIDFLPFREAIVKNGTLKIKYENAAVEITRVGDEEETRTPSDLKKALLASTKALATWEDITPIARRDWIFWIITAKQEETRARRIAKAIDKLSHGERRVCCFAGINWMMKNK